MVQRFGRSIAFGLVLALGACASSRLPAPVGDIVPDPEGFAAALRLESLPPSPEQVTFAWTLDEQGSRVRGRGVVRTEEGQRIRLDLFGPRGETYLMAALVGGQYRLPPEAANAVALPSPSLLWAALGVLDPPPGALVSSATTRDRTAELRYQTPDGQTFIYSFQQPADGDRFRLTRVERAARQGVLETVTLERDRDGGISRTRYRDWVAYRDLTLEVESIRQSAPFPPSIWRPDAIAN